MHALPSCENRKAEARTCIRGSEPSAAGSESLKDLERFFGLDHLAASVVAATGAGPMQQLGIAAIRTLHRLGPIQATVILAAPLAGARLRMLSLRVGHDLSVRAIGFVVANRRRQATPTAPQGH